MRKWEKFNLLEKILLKIFYLKSSISKNPMDSNIVCRKYFYNFNKSLEYKTNCTHEIHHKLRYLEIKKVIDSFKLSKVLEIGTGRTTFFFNSLNGIETISIEQDRNWFNIIKPLLNEANLASDIRLLDVVSYKEGGKFLQLDIDDCDLLYIDGPYMKKEKGSSFNTFTGKPAYYDFETIFNRGLFPKIIMVEGRTDTVDAINNSKYSNKYRFYGEFLHSLQRKRWISALRFRRHSVFIRK